MAEVFKDRVVRIADLVVVSDVIEGAYFENVQVVGPAVLLPLENAQITGCTFDVATPEALFWTIDDDRDEIVGGVGVRNSTFVNCRFSRVGLAAPRTQMGQLRRGFGLE